MSQEHPWGTAITSRSQRCASRRPRSMDSTVRESTRVSVPIVSRTSTSGALPCRQQTNWYPFPVVTRQQTSGRRPPSLPRASDVFTCAPFVRSPPDGGWNVVQSAVHVRVCSPWQIDSGGLPRTGTMFVYRKWSSRPQALSRRRSALMRPCPSGRPCNKTIKGLPPSAVESTPAKRTIH
jgi:hypothetical protein